VTDKQESRVYNVIAEKDCFSCIFYITFMFLCGCTKCDIISKWVKMLLIVTILSVFWMCAHLFWSEISCLN